MTSQNRAPLRLVVPPLDPPAGTATVPAPRPPISAPPAIEPLGDGTAPAEAECLPCYVDRLVSREGCDRTLRWSSRWRDARAPRAAKLERRLADRGGFCDCEVLFNVYPGHFRLADGPDDDDPDAPAVDEQPPCAGRTGGAATDPCRRPAKPWWA